MTKSIERGRSGVSIVIACACLCLLQSGCARDAPSGTRYQRALDRLASLEAASLDNEVSDEVLDERTTNECRSIANDLHSSQQLYRLFLESDQRKRRLNTQFRETQGPARINPYATACDEVINRLVEIKSPEAIRVLIALYEDERFQSLPSTAFALVEGWRSCGPPALVQLRALRRRRPNDEYVNWMIQAIEEDEAEKRGRKRNID